NEPNSGTMKIGDIMRCYISVGPIPVKDYTGLQYQGNFMGWLNSINSQYNATANLKVGSGHSIFLLLYSLSLNILY
ncbi:MAG: hypothetical protein J6L24_02095, partial [Oscillospiraceae bacterium]|nr:hypothetical protein [Oscillospiraceae bacterium]